MNCEQITELMQRYMDGDLAEMEQELLFAHIKHCPDCATTFSELQLLSAELSNLPKISPPFSIVDSIMPRLVEWDNQIIAAYAEPEIPRNRQHKRLFSWPIAGGFVAAAIILSFFIVDLTPTSKNDASKMLNINNAVTSSTADTSKQTNPEAIPKSAYSANEQDNPSAYTIPDAQKDKKIPQLMMKNQAQSEQAPPTEKKLESVGNEKKKVAASASSVAPSPSATSSTSMDANHIQVYFDQPISEPTPQPSDSKVHHSMAIEQQDPNAMKKSLADNQLATEDGNLIAFIIQQTVNIKNQNGDMVYTSLLQWKTTDTIHFLHWLDNTRLFYQVQLEDGQIKQYMIDLVTKKEQQQ
jgi:hypothetical protein